MTDQAPKSLEDELKNAIDQAEWAWLKTLAERDSVIVVSPELDLHEVAVAVAKDQKEKVQLWLMNRLIGKPTQENLNAWNATPRKKFLSVVVQPFALIQEIEG